MQRITVIRTIIRRLRWELGIVFLFLGVAACSEVAVDPDTANVTHRPKDTVLLIDTAILRDTTVHVDTVVQGFDTLFQTDTVVQVRTVIRTVQVIVKDTFYISDTVEIVKHEIIVDTLRELSPELERMGRIYRFGDGGKVVDSMAIEFDDLTRIVVLLKPGYGPESIQLKVIAHVPLPRVADTAKWGVTPMWFYLFIPSTQIKTGGAVRELVGDPRSMQKPGMAILPRTPWSPLWLVTEPPASNLNVFSVTKVDTNARLIYCSVKARFKKFDAKIDSLALVFKY